MDQTDFNKSYDLQSAIKAGSNQQIWEWTVEFLRSSGHPNFGLANKLEHEGRHHFGPAEYPLEQLSNIIGPDSSFKYVEDKEKLAARVEQMQSDINKGWQPPPIIATDFWEPYLEISDGE